MIIKTRKKEAKDALSAAASKGDEMTELCSETIEVK